MRTKRGQERQALKKMKRLNFDVPEDVHRQLKVICALKGVRMADLLRKLVVQYLSDERVGQS